MGTLMTLLTRDVAQKEHNDMVIIVIKEIILDFQGIFFLATSLSLLLFKLSAHLEDAKHLSPLFIHRETRPKVMLYIHGRVNKIIIIMTYHFIECLLCAIT